MQKNIFFLLGFILFFTTACDKTVVIEPTDDFKDVLANIANDVIIPTYLDLEAESSALSATLTTLKADTSPDNLAASLQAWRDARLPWEQAEGFLFGPIDQQGIDPSIDSWPVNEADLTAILNSGDALNKAYIDGLDGTLKGFHVIEYLLFGIDGQKTASDFTARELDYLTACGESLHAATQQLLYAWSEEGQNFVSNILTAGEQGNVIYPSQKSALQEIAIGIVTITDEVANGKINDPFVQQNLNLEESRFSANSKQDFADNIRSIQNIYWGHYHTVSTLGLSSVVAGKNIGLDTKIKEQIAAAITAIESIEGTFSNAVFNAPASVQNAQEQVRTLQQTLESELMPLIVNL